MLPQPTVDPVSSTAAQAIALPAPRLARSRLRLTGYALLLPSGVFLLGFTYWPVLQVLSGSLTVRAFGGAAHWGLGNFARLFADPHFAHAVANNLVYAAGTIVPSLVLALALALGLRESTRLNAMLRTLIVLPLLIPLVAAASLFIFIFLPGAGLLDYYLARLGLGADQLAGRSVAGARLDHRDHGVEEHRLLHAVLPGRPRRHPAGAAGRREDRRRRRLGSASATSRCRCWGRRSPSCW